MDRRLFLKSLAAAGLMAATGPTFANAACARTKIGLQLYTVRDRMAEGVEKTLNAVAGLGYGEVEFAGYFDHAPKDVRRMLADAGLKSPSTHVPLDMFENGFDAVIAFAGEVGHRYLILPWLTEPDRTVERFKSIADILNKAGERAKAAGLTVAYHNHDFEFVPIGGVQPYEILLADTNPDLVKLQLDLYWLNVAGVDPLNIIRRFPGRVPLVHVKDRTAAGEMTEVGSGAIDFGRVFDQAAVAGLEHYMVEHDNPGDAMASIGASINYLKAEFPWLCA